MEEVSAGATVSDESDFISDGVFASEMAGPSSPACSGAAGLQLP